jgi:queuine tRNA-ribosyltransferase
MNRIETPHGDLSLPAFLPDATRGAVRTLEARDVAGCGLEALMVNALHLLIHPGGTVISSLGGIHSFMGWEGPVASDSGGFQVLSLINGSPRAGVVTHQGFSYRLSKEHKKRKLTPKTSIHRQLRLGADILFCLDHCTHPESNPGTQRESVENTVRWAKACREAFDSSVTETEGRRPLLFGIIQGGESRELRLECAQRLLEIGFDGYGYGGWPIDREGNLLPSVECTAQLIPQGLPKHALGIGKPENLVRAFRMGYDLFDCVIPTRDARHRRLYVFAERPSSIDLGDPGFYSKLYMEDKKHARESRPVDETCDCACCSRYSRAYLHHLFKIDDPVALRLATIHNLRFYARLMEHLRKT